MTKRNRKKIITLQVYSLCQGEYNASFRWAYTSFFNLSITMQYIYSSIYQPVLKCQMLTKKSAILGMFNSTKGVGSMWDEWVHGCYHEVEPKFFLFYIRPYFLTIPNTSDCAIWKSAPAIFLQIQMSSGIKNLDGTTTKVHDHPTQVFTKIGLQRSNISISNTSVAAIIQSPTQYINHTIFAVNKKGYLRS